MQGDPVSRPVNVINHPARTRSERIIEVSFGDGRSLLIACRDTPDGPLLDMYRADEGIRISLPDGSVNLPEDPGWWRTP